MYMNSMEWISVKDRLPSDEQDVIVTDGKNVLQTFYAIYDSGISWGTSRWVGEITHWMPLPEPPQS